MDALMANNNYEEAHNKHTQPDPEAKLNKFNSLADIEA